MSMNTWKHKNSTTKNSIVQQYSGTLDNATVSSATLKSATWNNETLK